FVIFVLSSFGKSLQMGLTATSGQQRLLPRMTRWGEFFYPCNPCNPWFKFRAVFSIRKAITADIPAIWRVRYSVRENTLRPGLISDADVQQHLEVIGTGWVCEQEGSICAFAIGNARNGQVWALFVEPQAQGRGMGSALHAELLEWFRQQPVR